MVPIIGLGNPGREYESTRHNAGFWVLQSLARESGFSFSLDPSAKFASCKGDLIVKEKTFPVALCMPLTYMNRSGDCLRQFYELYEIPFETKPIVVVDQMDLPPGQTRLKSKGGTAGHNGLKSIYSYIEDRYYPLYLGIGRPAQVEDVIDYVLGIPSEAEELELKKAIQKCVDGLYIFASESPERAMEYINARQV